MRVLVLLVSSAGFAQSRPDAVALLREVAESARTAQSWRIEGSIADSDFDRHQPNPSFTFLSDSTKGLRFELQGGPTPETVVCNAANAQIYSPPLNRYESLTSAQDSRCSPIVGDWEALPAALHEPRLAGHKIVQVGGQTWNCLLVRGWSEPELKSAGRLTRTLCIDPDRKLVLWEKAETKYGSRTYLYDRVDRNAGVPDQAFAFEPPSGSQPTVYELPVLRPLGSRSMPSDPDLTLPKPVFRVEPPYDEASRKARIQGTVVLYLVIDTSGVPADVAVFRTLSPGMDAQAIAALRRWRFTPALKAGQTVAVASLVEMNFKLLD